MKKEKSRNHKSAGRISVQDINEILRKAISLVEYQYRKRDVVIGLSLSEEPLLAELDKGEMLKVLLTILLEILKSLELRKGRRVLHIETSEKGKYCEILIRDNAPEPFSQGMRGTEPRVSEIIFGSALHRTAHMVESLGGIISWHTSAMERSFRIVIPLAEEYRLRSKGVHKILIVDDEDVVLDVLAGYLHHMGSIAFTYNSPLKALEDMERITFDMGIIDLRMPGMGGLEFIRRIESWLPRNRIILLTGDILSIEAGLASRYPEIPVIEKPVNFRKLQNAVRLIEGRK